MGSQNYQAISILIIRLNARSDNESICRVQRLRHLLFLLGFLVSPHKHKDGQTQTCTCSETFPRNSSSHHHFFLCHHRSDISTTSWQLTSPQEISKPTSSNLSELRNIASFTYNKVRVSERSQQAARWACFPSLADFPLQRDEPWLAFADGQTNLVHIFSQRPGTLAKVVHFCSLPPSPCCFPPLGQAKACANR